jgi:hypothetical protein
MSMMISIGNNEIAKIIAEFKKQGGNKIKPLVFRHPA